MGPLSVSIDHQGYSDEIMWSMWEEETAHRWEEETAHRAIEHRALCIRQKDIDRVQNLDLLKTVTTQCVLYLTYCDRRSL